MEAKWIGRTGTAFREELDRAVIAVMVKGRVNVRNETARRSLGPAGRAETQS